MFNVDRRARGENGERARVVRGDGLRRHILRLNTSEGRSNTSITGDGEAVGGQLGERATGVVEELQGLITGVDESSDHLQVVHTIDG